jgi:hypothetical protein
MFVGVTKSGSPTVKLMTSFIAPAMLNIFLIGDPVTSRARREISLMYATSFSTTPRRQRDYL